MEPGIPLGDDTAWSACNSFSPYISTGSTTPPSTSNSPIFPPSSPISFSPYLPGSPSYTPIQTPLDSPRLLSPPASPLLPAEIAQCHPDFTEGDLLISIHGGESFVVHRALLELASDKLADLAKAATNNRIYLWDDQPSRGFQAMLDWIYPRKSMHICRYDVLDEALTTAKRYHLGAMRDALRSLLTQPDSPVNLRNDPLHAYSIATTHALPSEARKAAQLALGKVDFRRDGALEELKSRGVSVECAFKLAQRQFAWECVLADCLLRANTVNGEELVLEENEWTLLVCAECVSWGEADRPTGLVGWQRNWIERVYERLICTPLDDCAYMFRPEYVTRVWDEGCERCMVRLMRHQRVLDVWMQKVWEMLESKWAAIFDEI
ncbi:hypothetical protein FRC12_003350 [Ceratobasidium sp. 428]|nr:hypothetical protein FRC12_003350 [Ceratobasidium sp. 428]